MACHALAVYRERNRRANMRVLVLGAGGTGGYFGGRLAQHGADVTFLVRERRYLQLSHDGPRIESVFGDAAIPVRAIRAGKVDGTFDVVMAWPRSPPRSRLKASSAMGGA
jgi:ketopantoate reductase